MATEKSDAAISLYDKGLQHEAKGERREAWASYVDALNAVPEPDYEQPITVDILKRMGELQFGKPDYAKAKQCFEDAVRCRGSLGDVIIHLRLGQCNYELGDLRRAGDNLARAYMGGGREAFEREDPKYLEYLKTILSPPVGQTEL